MPRFIAFLRAINAGQGRVVKIASLRQVFEALGFSAVTTFIASGNVMFKCRATNVKRLERKIEKRLYEALGFEVPVFVRSEIELLEVARVRPFPRSWTIGGDLNIIFLTDPLDDQTRRRGSPHLPNRPIPGPRSRDLLAASQKAEHVELFDCPAREGSQPPVYDPRGCD